MFLHGDGKRENKNDFIVQIKKLEFVVLNSINTDKSFQMINYYAF